MRLLILKTVQVVTIESDVRVLIFEEAYLFDLVRFDTVPSKRLLLVHINLWNFMIAPSTSCMHWLFIFDTWLLLES